MFWTQPFDFAVAEAGKFLLISAGILVLAGAPLIGLVEGRKASVAVSLLILAMILAHIYGTTILNSPLLQTQFMIQFAFVPIRYMPTMFGHLAPSNWGIQFWSPFTYAFLHKDAMHLFGNSLVLFVFGRCVAWRIGVWRFLAMFLITAMAGSLAYLIFNWGSSAPLIGSSAAGFGIMAATFRFVPHTDDRLKALFWPDEQVRDVPQVSILGILAERRSIQYVLICLLIFPLGLTALIAGFSGQIAVSAHFGGFTFGVLAFGLFDKQRTNIAVRPLPNQPNLKSVQRETVGLRLLRFAFVVLMVFGMLSGLIYYIRAFIH